MNVDQLFFLLVYEQPNKPVGVQIIELHEVQWRKKIQKNEEPKWATTQLWKMEENLTSNGGRKIKGQKKRKCLNLEVSKEDGEEIARNDETGTSITYPFLGIWTTKPNCRKSKNKIEITSRKWRNGGETKGKVYRKGMLTKRI